MPLQHVVKDYKNQIVFLVTGTLVGLCIGFALHGYLNQPKDDKKFKKEDEKKEPLKNKVYHPRGGKKFETGQMSFSEIHEDQEIYKESLESLD